MSDASRFPPDYATARERFLAAAAANGARLEAFPIGLSGPKGEELAIDAAILGAERPSRTLIVSGGLHGVEGRLGSAIQVALLEEGFGDPAPGSGSGVVLLHALDPFGFAWTRRFDEEGIDLNRNFLLPGEAYRGSPEGYALLDPLLNPRYPPADFDPFRLRAWLTVRRRGMAMLKAAVSGGQYEFPQGLFFGGHGPSRLQRLLADVLPRWVGEADRVVHIDIHTGLGRRGTCKLLSDQEPGAPRLGWLAGRFGEEVEAADSNGISYAVRGALGPWCQALFPGRQYDLLVAEFGTYGPLSVLAALRAENQAHHWGTPDAPATRHAKARLREVFAPANPRWRAGAIARGLAIVRRAQASVIGP